MGTVIPVQNADFDRLVDLAESGTHARLNRFLGGIARLSRVGVACGEATLHQRAKRGLVAPVVKAVALCDLNALLGRLVIGH